MHLPTPYPDELLYSIIARYHIRSGNTSPKATLDDLFKSRTIYAVVDLPCHIDQLISNISPFMGLDSVQIIMENTLFPYYTAFLPNDRFNMILSSMRGNFGGDVHTRVGIMASSIKSPEFLRYCPRCHEDDRSRFGEFYWHRMHQLTGIEKCTIHNTFLLDSSVKLHTGNNNEFIAANIINCANKATNLYVTQEEDKVYSAISNHAEWLIKNSKLVRNSYGIDDGFGKRYIDSLIEMGYATVNGRVNQQRLIEDFVEFYGVKFLFQMQSYVNSDSDWLSSMLRKQRKSTHPLRHLLFMNYLKGGIDNFILSPCEYKPFGHGPWPCLNAAADHYKKSVIKELIISHCSDTKRPVGTFKCDCGFIYSRRGPDRKYDDIFKDW